MKAYFGKIAGIPVWTATLLLLTNLATYGQTQINLATQSRNVDFTNFPYTRPIKTGQTLPLSCAVGDTFLNTSANAGQNLFACIAANTWAQQAGLADPGANGLVKRTANNTTTVVAAPGSTIVGVSDAQTLTNKSIDASEITTGTLPTSRMPALAGDITSSSGSVATALATVNSTPGTYGDATHATQLTVDAKGRVVSLSSIALSTPYNTVSKAGNAFAQRPTLNLSSAFNLTDNSGASRTDIDLATVNANPGTFGSATQIPVLTVNAYGQVTGVTLVSPTASGNSASSGSVTANAGAFATIPNTCSAGALFLATDQPVAQQLYTCSSANTWTPLLSVGPSGALSVSNGSIDLVTSVVPRLTATNTFAGVNNFNAGLRLTPSSSQPSCDSSVRGMLWFQNNGSAKDSMQICVYTGSTYSWINLY